MPGDVATSVREPPSGSLFRNLNSPPPAPLGGGSAGGSTPRPAAATAEHPYLFISYARRDAETVYPLIEQLARCGVSLWIDRRIIGGDDWITELETRLINCVGMVALISRSFVESKYCAREVHFADALNRPILPVALVPGFELGSGLKFLLNSVQIIDVHETGSIQPLLDAIDRHAPVARTPTG